MITNERQYKVSRTQAAKFEQAIKEFNELALIKEGLHPVLVSAQRNALESQFKELRAQIRDYEALRSGEIKNLSANAIGQLGQKLIEARIAQGLTQKELANRLRMKEQQIQRYENESYASASLSRLAEVSAALDVNFQFGLTIEDAPKVSANKIATHIDLSELPLKIAKQRKWFDFSSSSLEEQQLLVRQYFEPAFQNAAPALLRQGTRLEASFDDYALLAWKARIIWKAREIQPVPPTNFSELSWLKAFKEFTLHDEGPVLAIEYLKTKGIVVVIEGHLPKTHLDGAAFLIDQSLFTIALTLRHDRLDNFWFVLLHELGHIVLHRETGLKRGFFDDDQVGAVEKLEREADEFAKSVLLPAELWLTSLIRFTQSAEQIVAFAEDNRVSPAIIAGWLRRERNDYTVFKELVGYGRVRRTLKEAGLLETANVGST